MEDFLLDDELITQETNLVPASKNKRLANYVIDYIGVIVSIIVLYALIDEFDTGGGGVNGLADRLIGMLVYAIYYSFVEGGLKGKSLGKFVTKTRVVNLDGSTPEFGTFVLRSLSRIVPFEAFSFLGKDPDGWHDRWTDTMVIDEQKSEGWGIF